MCFWWEIYYQLQENSRASIKNIFHLFNFFLLYVLIEKSLFSDICESTLFQDDYETADSFVLYKNVTIKNIMRSKIKFWELLLNQWAWCIFGISKEHFMGASSNLFIHLNLYENNMSLYIIPWKHFHFRDVQNFPEVLMTASGSKCFLLLADQLHFKLWN